MRRTVGCWAGSTASGGPTNWTAGRAGGSMVSVKALEAVLRALSATSRVKRAAIEESARFLGPPPKPPGPQSGWSRLVLRSGERPVSVILLEWEIIP